MKAKASPAAKRSGVRSFVPEALAAISLLPPISVLASMRRRGHSIDGRLILSAN
jgi:hypothetical protein